VIKTFRRRASLSAALIALSCFRTAACAAPEPVDDASVAASIQALAKQALSASDVSVHLSDERSWLDRFYAPTSYEPVWTHDGYPDPILAIALDELRIAPDRGLDPSDYDVDRLTSEAARTDADSEEAMAPAGKTRFAKLTTPVPVAIFYSTAMMGESGEALFLPDIYGWDDDLESALTARKDQLASR
jgi:murein L,D-transpeptidase YcbB/YkuD